MNKPDVTPPSCYADLNTVFPMGKTGLRETPDTCMACDSRIECLRAAIATEQGSSVREEMVDRQYSSGMIGFFQRWSEKKRLNSKRPTAPKRCDSKEDS